MEQASLIVEDGPGDGEPPDEPPEKQSSVFGKIPSLIKNVCKSAAPFKKQEAAGASTSSDQEAVRGAVHTPKTAASLKFLSSISLDFSGLRRRSTIVEDQTQFKKEENTEQAGSMLQCAAEGDSDSHATEAMTGEDARAEHPEVTVRPMAACSRSFESSFKFLSSISLVDEHDLKAKSTTAPNLAKQDSARSEADTLSDTLLADRFACDSPNEQPAAGASDAPDGAVTLKKRLLSPPAPLELTTTTSAPPGSTSSKPSSVGSAPALSPSLDAKRQQESLDFLTGISLEAVPSPHLPAQPQPSPCPAVAHAWGARRDLFGSSTSSMGSLEGFWGEGGLVSRCCRKMLDGYVLVRQGRRKGRSSKGCSTPEEAGRAQALSEVGRDKVLAMDADFVAGALELEGLEGAAAGAGEKQSVWGGSPVGGVQLERPLVHSGSLATLGSVGSVGSSKELRERAQPRHNAVKAEGGLAATHLQSSAVYVCQRGRGGLRPPMALFSVLRPRVEEGKGGAGAGEVTQTRRLEREGSYALLLNGKAAKGGAGGAEGGWEVEGGGGKHGAKKSPRYDPLFLDDPEIRIAKDRTVIKEESFIFSCIPFVKPKLMKEELNALFLAKHGDWMEGSEITLSKLRALKANMVEAVAALDVELSTAALAHVLLEKLILRNLVKKQTRKVTAAVCVLLAFKMNEVPRCTAIAAMQEGLDRLQPPDSSLFVAAVDALGAPRPLPLDLLKLVDKLRARRPDYESPQKHPRASSSAHYLLASFPTPHAAAAAKDALTRHHFGPDRSLRAVVDFVPDFKSTSTGGRTGRLASVSDLLHVLHHKLGVSRRAILEQEWPTFVDLEMDLHVEAEELLPHFNRILANQDLAPAAYLGQDCESLMEAEAFSLEAEAHRAEAEAEAAE